VTLFETQCIYCDSWRLQANWIFKNDTPPPHHNCFTALFPGPPGWAGASREPLVFTVQGRVLKQLIVEKPNCLLTESCICISCPLHPDCLVQKCFGEMLSLTAITHCMSSSSDSLLRRGMQLSLFHAMTQLPSQQQPKRTPCNFFGQNVHKTTAC